jgi:hypothetical protein
LLCRLRLPDGAGTTARSAQSQQLRPKRLPAKRLRARAQGDLRSHGPKLRIFYSIKSNGHVPIEDVDLTQSGDAVVDGEDPAVWGLDPSRYGVGD